MDTTKEKIIRSAIALFNKNGLVNVRLQHIADEAGISVGNLAYHFYSKKAIVTAIDAQLESEIRPLLNTDKDFQYLIDFDNHLSSYYYLLNRYTFYFLDVLEMERAYPRLHGKRKEYIGQMILQVKEWLLLNVKKGVLKKEVQENQYEQTALTIWMIVTFWMTQLQVRGATGDNEGNFKEVVWNQLISNFTHDGFMEFEAIILPQLKYYTD